MTIANVFFGAIAIVTFGYIGFHYFQEWKSNRQANTPMATFNKR